MSTADICANADNAILLQQLQENLGNGEGVRGGYMDCFFNETAFAIREERTYEMFPCPASKASVIGKSCHVIFAMDLVQCETFLIQDSFRQEPSAKMAALPQYDAFSFVHRVL